MLLDAGFEPVDPPPHENTGELSPGCVAELLPTCDGMIAGSEKLDGALFAKCPNLKIIARTGVGYDAVDVASARERGIAVTITPGANQESVAEQAFGLLFGLTRRIVVNCADIATGGWNRSMPIPIRGKTLGLVGLGRIGQAMVPRARAFGMNVIGYDPVISAANAPEGVSVRSLDEVIEGSDILSLHVPMTPDTRHLVRAETIIRMKRGVILINTARGGLIRETDLVAALESGQIGGACLDVTDPEPPLADNPLRRMSNVILSPHLGGIDTLSMDDMANMAARCVVESLRGQTPVECLVPELRLG
jgi:phosphoglycerate dehydrogenase-like enzyme